MSTPNNVETNQTTKPLTREIKIMRSQPATPETTEIRSLNEKILELKDLLQERGERLNNGRNFLMSAESRVVTVSDALVAFGWTSDGMGCH